MHSTGVEGVIRAVIEVGPALVFKLEPLHTVCSKFRFEFGDLNLGVDHLLIRVFAAWEIFFALNFCCPAFLEVTLGG